MKPKVRRLLKSIGEAVLSTAASEATRALSHRQFDGKKVARWVLDATSVIEGNLPSDHPTHRLWKSATHRLMSEGQIGLLQSPPYIDMLTGILESTLDEESDSSEDEES